MKLEENEFTTTSFIAMLKKEFKTKVNGEDFTSNDIAQYLRKGYTPYAYGHYKISNGNVEGVRIIIMEKKKK